MVTTLASFWGHNSTCDRVPHALPGHGPLPGSSSIRLGLQPRELQEEDRNMGMCAEGEQGSREGEGGKQGMRRAEETLHIRVPFTALEDSQCRKRLWGLANSCTSPFYEMRVCSKAHRSTQITVSDKTSQARYLLSSPGPHSPPTGASRSKEGPGSVSLPAREPRPLSIPGDIDQSRSTWEETDQSRKKWVCLEMSRSGGRGEINSG